MSGVLAIVGLAGCTDARVARGKDHGDTTTTELGDEVAYRAGVFLGDTLPEKDQSKNN